MKTIFFSDVHKDVESLKKLVSKEEGIFYCLGDSELPQEILDEYNIISVRGNCDIEKYKDNIIINLDNKKVLLTHGHLYNVKFTLNNLFFYAKSVNCDTVIFGHTHQITFIDDEVCMYNPGSLRDLKSYLVYDNNKFEIKYL